MVSLGPRWSQRRSDYRVQASVSAAQRTLAVAHGIVLMALGVPHFGMSTLGVWLVLQSIVTYASTASVGVPVALLGAFSRTSSAEGRAAILKTALQVTLGIGLVAAGAVILAVSQSDRVVAAIGDAPSLEAVRMASGVFLGGSLLLLPASTIVAGVGGVGRVVTQQALESLRVLARLAAVVWVVSYDGTIVDLAVATVVGEGVTALVASRVLLRGSLSLRRVRRASTEASRGFIPSSLRFFGLQLQHLVIQQSDLLVARAVVGLDAVTELAAPHRAYQAAISIVLGALGAPSWPAMGAAIADRDFERLARIHERNVRVTVVVLSWAWVVGGALLPAIIRVWVGRDFPTDEALIYTIGAYAFAYCYTAQQAMVLNALDCTQPQLRIMSVEAAINLGASILLGRSLGLVGVMLGSIAGIVLTSGWRLGRVVHRETGGVVSAGGPLFVKVALYSAPAAAVAHSAVAAENDLAAVAACFVFAALSGLHVRGLLKAPAVSEDPSRTA